MKHLKNRIMPPKAVLLLIIAVLPLVMGATPQSEDFLLALNPYICVTEYEVVKGNVEAGTPFELKVVISNVSPIADAYNIMVSYFFAGESGFYQSEGETNQRFINHIPPGASKEIFLMLEVDDNVQKPVVRMETNFSYLNANGIPYSNQTNFSVFQKKTSALSLNAFSLPKEGQIDKKVLANIQLRNIGKTDLQNVELTLTGTFNESPQTYKFDEMSIEEQRITDTYLTFSQAGSQYVNAKVTYENEWGDKFEINADEQSILITAESPLQNESFYIAEKSTNADKAFWRYICIASSVLALITLIAIMIKAKRKKGAK